MAASADESAETPAAPTDHLLLRRILSFRHLFILSAIHSVLFTGLMLCAFVLDHPQPATFIFGFLHGVLYMAMALMVIVAGRLGTITWTTALVVIALGAMGPYFGTLDFWRESRRQHGGGDGEPEPAGA